MNIVAKKCVHVVRHAESMYNKKKKELESQRGETMEGSTPFWLSELDDDTSLHDCSISELGVQQAKVTILSYE